jgi:hypothetical protein
MAKAASDNNIDFSSADWLPLDNAFKRFIEAARGNPLLAVRELHRALSEGRLRSGVSQMPVRYKTPTGSVWHPENELRVLLRADCWRNNIIRMQPAGDKVRCYTKEIGSGLWAWYFFVWLADLDKVFLSAKSTSAKPDAVHRNPPQTDRVTRAIRKLFPHGVPDEMPTTGIHKAVVDALKSETKQYGLKDPSRFTVARVIGRQKI